MTKRLKKTPLPTVWISDKPCSCKECSEHRNLLKAAPDLLAAAKEFVRKVECGEARSTKSLAQFKAAIAKATTGEVLTPETNLPASV